MIKIEDAKEYMIEIWENVELTKEQTEALEAVIDYLQDTFR